MQDGSHGAVGFGPPLSFPNNGTAQPERIATEETAAFGNTDPKWIDSNVAALPPALPRDVSEDDNDEIPSEPQEKFDEATEEDEEEDEGGKEAEETGVGGGGEDDDGEKSSSNALPTEEDEEEDEGDKEAEETGVGGGGEDDDGEKSSSNALPTEEDEEEDEGDKEAEETGVGGGGEDDDGDSDEEGEVHPQNGENELVAEYQLVAIVDQKKENHACFKCEDVAQSEWDLVGGPSHVDGLTKWYYCPECQLW